MAPAAKPSSSSKSQLKLARDALDARDTAGALALCKAVLSSDRSNYNAYVLTGLALSRSGEARRASQAYERAISLRPDAPVAYRGLADALSDEEGAAERLRRARALVQLADRADVMGARAEACVLYYELVVGGGGGEARDEAVAAWKGLETAPDRFASVEVGIVGMMVGEKYLFEEGVLCEALDVLEVKAGGGDSDADVRAQRVVVQRVRLRAERGDLGMRKCADVLMALGEGEEFLAMVEEDFWRKGGVLEFGAEPVAEYARRVLDGGTKANDAVRAHAVVAASGALVNEARAEEALKSVLASLAGAMEDAGRKAGRPIASSNFAALIQAISAPWQALVLCRLYYELGEMKKCRATAVRGVHLCGELGGRRALTSAFHLIRALSLAADGSDEKAMKEFELSLNIFSSLAKANAPRSGFADWIERACVRGMLKLGVAMSDGESAVKRACSSGLEHVAVMGEIEEAFGVQLDESSLSTMKALVKRVTGFHEAQLKDGPVQMSFEQALFGDSLTGCAKENSAIANLRLAQTYCRIYGDGPANPAALAGLDHAKDALITSANLVGTMADPYAVLGWIFEVQARQHDDVQVSSTRKLFIRAIRCYRKCVLLDMAHPLASRRLVRLLQNLEDSDDFGGSSATAVARDVTKKSPRCSWAWNVLAWSNLISAQYSDASIAFQSALKSSAKSELGFSSFCLGLVSVSAPRCAEDSDAMVRIDSWRGLATAYKALGKFAPACSCLETALKLVAESGSEQEELEKVVVSEIAALMTLQKKPKEAIDICRPYLEGMGIAAGFMPKSGERLWAKDSLAQSCHCSEEDVVGAASLSFRMAEAFMALADAQWIEGWYRRAFATRQAGSSLFAASHKFSSLVPRSFSPAAGLKRIGDALSYTASSSPSALSRLVPLTVIRGTLEDAEEAFLRALDFTVEEAFRDGCGEDLGSTLAKLSSLDGDVDKAEQAVRFLSDRTWSRKSQIGERGGSALAFALGVRANSSEDQLGKSCMIAAKNLLARTIAESKAGDDELLTSALRLTELHFESKDVQAAADSALTALRLDATDWRSWFATGLARECDGNALYWPSNILKSTVDAYAEADRIGGGGPAVVTRLCRSLERNVDSSDKKDLANVASDAAMAVATAVRAGLSPSETCLNVVRNNAKCVFDANSDAADVDVDGTGASVHRLFHMYPFVPKIQQQFESLAGEY